MNIKAVAIKVLYITITVIVFVVALKMFNFSTEKETFQKEELQKPQKATIKAFKIPDSLTLGGDKVPLERFDVRESLDNELLSVGNYHSQAFKNLKRAARYFPIIEPILEEYGVPNDFKYLAVAESNLDNVHSSAGAHGFWQFMKATGLSYNLEIRKEVDERYHLEKSTRAACKYLKKAHNHYNDWALAAASYNYGRGNVNKQLTRQKVDNYYDLHLNRETARYVFRILAIKLVYDNPEQFNLHLDEEDYYQTIETKEIIVKTTIVSLIDFAKFYKTTYKIVKILNPWLRSDKLTNSNGKEYRIKVPVENTEKQE